MHLSNIPISLYIHIPWCLHKCPYCDFNSHEKKGSLPEDSYLDTLVRDFKQQTPSLQSRKLQSIFIGGGTPSLISANFYQKLLKEIGNQTDLSELKEVTLEANPGTFERDRFAAYRSAGINRLSIGVQSFNNKKLKTLQRIHDANEAIAAIKEAQSVGFDNFNIDLMFGLPEQTIDEGLNDLQQAIALNPTHISWYQLTLEPNTFFHRFPPQLPNADYIWELQQAGQALLEKSNYKQYEVSAYARPEKQCLHNRNYWEFGDYIGIGAGAHGKVTDYNQQSIHRRWNHKNPKDYLNENKQTLAGEKAVEPQDRSLEFMMNALRLNEPIPFEMFETRTGLDRSTLYETLKTAESQGLLQHDQEKILLTTNGQGFLNDLLALF